MPRSREFAVCRLVVCPFMLVACQACELVARQLAIGCLPLLSVNYLLVSELDAFQVAAYRLAACHLPAYACNLVA